MALSPKFKQETFNQRSTDTEVILLTLSHASWDDDIRLCTAQKDVLSISDATNRPIHGIISRGQEFIYVGLGVKLPNSTDSQAPEASFTFSAVTREVTAKLKMVDKSYPKLKMEVVSYIDPDTVEMEYPEMTLNSSNWNLTQGDVSLQNYSAVNEACHPWRMTKATHPNLFDE